MEMIMTRQNNKHRMSKDKVQKAKWRAINNLLKVIIEIIGLFAISSIVIFKNIGDNNFIFHHIGDDATITVDQSTTETNIYQFDSALDILEQANIMLRKGEYDEALLAYEDTKCAKNQAVLINLGYLYGNGLTLKGEDIDKAISLYLEADCVEAKRNLLALYLKHRMYDEAESILAVLLDGQDKITIECVAKSLYEGTEYPEANEIEIKSDKVALLIDYLIEWKYIDNWYRGYNPPSDTRNTMWIFQGIDFAVDNSVNHPISSYRECVRLFVQGIQDIEKCYYLEDDVLKELR